MADRYREQHATKFNERKHSTDAGNYIGRVIRIEGLHKDGSAFPIELVVSSWTTDDGVFFSGVIRNVEDAEIRKVFRKENCLNNNRGYVSRQEKLDYWKEYNNRIDIKEKRHQRICTDVICPHCLAIIQRRSFNRHLRRSDHSSE